MSDGSPPIETPYLLVINVMLIADGGRFWAEPLWHKDLLLHLVAIERLELACPVERGVPPSGWLPVGESRITILPLSSLSGRRRALFGLASTVCRLWGAIGRARIVHTGVAGWPIPLGWIATPIARIRGRFLMIGVESSFWRVPAGTKASPAKRIKARVFEAINRACLDSADLTFFTTEEYRRSLLRHPRGVSHVTPATWVDPQHLIAPGARPHREGRLLFAGRMTEQKGVRVLIDALERSEARVDFIGEGDLSNEVRAIAAQYPDRIRMLDPVPYGPEFFALLDRYAAIIVPTLSEEQPRILFDAYSRGLPAIASDTSGNRQLVTDGVEGRLVPAGDAIALARALDAVASDPAGFVAMGDRARATMDNRTHEAMHLGRATLIRDALAR